VSSNRFDHIEDDLPEKLQSAIDRLNRFAHLEIGARGAPPPLPAASGKAACAHCGQSNEKGREICWACFKNVGGIVRPGGTAAGPEAAPLELVLDGKVYRSDDADLPEDIRVLIGRVQKEGYSPRLLADWRQWRATRRVNVAPARAFDAGPAKDVAAFKGQRVSVIRMDGKTYTSDMRDLSPELQELFIYIEEKGVTPALMEHLRRNGASAKFRPETTGEPSDGDVGFWDGLKNLF